MTTTTTATASERRERRAHWADAIRLAEDEGQETLQDLEPVIDQARVEFRQAIDACRQAEHRVADLVQRREHISAMADSRKEFARRQLRQDAERHSPEMDTLIAAIRREVEAISQRSFLPSPSQTGESPASRARARMQSLREAIGYLERLKLQVWTDDELARELAGVAHDLGIMNWKG